MMTPEEKIARKELKKFTAELTDKYDWNGNLTDDECQKYINICLAGGAKIGGYAISSWHYAMGRIGSCSLYWEGPGENAKRKDFYKHPDWRPIGKYSFSVRGWGNDYIHVEGYIQDWNDIPNISDTESFDITIFKHPIQ